MEAFIRKKNLKEWLSLHIFLLGLMKSGQL